MLVQRSESQGRRFTSFHHYYHYYHTDHQLSTEPAPWDNRNGWLGVKHQITYLLTYSLTHSLTHLLTYLLTHLLTHLLAHSLAHSLTYLLTYLLTYSLTHLLTYSLTHSLTHSLTYSLTHLLTYLLTRRSQSIDTDKPDIGKPWTWRSRITIDIVREQTKRYVTFVRWRGAEKSMSVQRRNFGYSLRLLCD